MGGEVWAIVLAAGRGVRFGGLKQLAMAGGERLVDRAVRTATATCDGVVVVLPAGLVWDGPVVDRQVSGGASRADSVRAGLAAVPPVAAIVVVADAAHPLASAELHRHLIDAVRAGADGAVATTPMLEIVQVVEQGRVVATMPKEGTRITQMPQAFRAEALRVVHRGDPDAVDDSTLLVARGAVVVPVDGEPWNLHVSTAAELDVVGRLASWLDEATAAQPVSAAGRLRTAITHEAKR